MSTEEENPATSYFPPRIQKPLDQSIVGQNTGATEEEQEARRRYVERTIEKRSAR